MKISAQEEYGLRILLRLAKNKELSISEISSIEGLSHHNAAKLCRILRMNGYISSTKGHKGGYTLSMSPTEINLKPLLHSLGGSLYQEGYCERFAHEGFICTNSNDCAIRSVWKMVQLGVDKVLNKLTLDDLLGTEAAVEEACK